MEITVPKERKCIKENDLDVLSLATKQIHVPIEQEEYNQILYNHVEFRKKLDLLIKEYPEIFPRNINKGYYFHSYQSESKKIPDFQCRRIKLKADKEVYSILPYFVMPYMRGYCDDLEKPLYLKNFGIPNHAMTYVFGKNDMFWYRLFTSLGRNSIVGTTIQDRENLPEHIIADEKFSWENKDNVYLATTVANDCFLGSRLADQAEHLSLLRAYRDFKKEAQNIDSNYSPQSVTTDGWKATRWAWQILFPATQLILCFLHSFLKIRDAYSSIKKHAGEIYSQIWLAYYCQNETSFRAEIGYLKLFAHIYLPKGKALKAIEKICSKVDLFAKVFQVPGGYRTTANLDRLMDRQDRFLYACKYFHGHKISSQFLVRSFALLHNFAPYSSRSRLPFISPAHRINRSFYHENWLRNFHISSSMGGFSR